MITLIRLEGHLIDGAEALLSKDVDFVGVDDFWGDSRVDTGGLDGDDEVTTVLDEHGGVESENTGLIWLGDIGEDDIDHRHQHSVLLRVSGILDNGDDIGSLLGHVDEVTSDSLGELNGVDGALGSDDVRDMGNGSAGGSTDVKDLAAGLNVDLIATTGDTSSELRSEGVPGTVLDFLSVLLLKLRNERSSYRHTIYWQLAVRQGLGYYLLQLKFSFRCRRTLR